MVDILGFAGGHAVRTFHLLRDPPHFPTVSDLRNRHILVAFLDVINQLFSRHALCVGDAIDARFVVALVAGSRAGNIRRRSSKKHSELVKK